MEQNLELALGKTIVENEEQYIFVEPVCDFFKISFKNQKRTINEDSILQSEGTKKYHELLFGDKRLRLCLSKRGFIRWIQIINAQLVHPELRDLFVQYQVAVFDYLWTGNIQKTDQLEDIRKYAENINTAIMVNRQVMEYISEQKQHRDLCLASSAIDWARIKPTLIEEKALPESKHLKAIGSDLPNDIQPLRYEKHRLQNVLRKNINLLLYNSRSPQKEENPMQEGYRKEMIKIKNKNLLAELEIIDQKILELSNKQLSE